MNHASPSPIHEHSFALYHMLRLYPFRLCAAITFAAHSRSSSLCRSNGPTPLSFPRPYGQLPEMMILAGDHMSQNLPAGQFIHMILPRQTQLPVVIRPRLEERFHLDPERI